MHGSFFSDLLSMPTYAYTHAYSDLHMPTSQATDVLPTYMQAYTHANNNNIMPSSVPIAYIISAAVATGVALLLVTGVVAISCYIIVKRVYTYRRTLLTTTAAPTASPGNDVLYEEISPIYETPSTTISTFEARLMLDKQDLFTHVDTNFTHSNSDCITKGIQLVDNEAYNHNTSLLKDPITTKATVTDDSFSTAEHDYDVCTSNDQAEGLFEPLYDDTVI